MSRTITLKSRYWCEEPTNKAIQFSIPADICRSKYVLTGFKVLNDGSDVSVNFCFNGNTISETTSSTGKFPLVIPMMEMNYGQTWISVRGLPEGIELTFDPIYVRS